MESHEYACFKRCLDYYFADKEIRELIDENPIEAVKRLGYEGILNPLKVRKAIYYVAFGIDNDDDVKCSEGNEYINEYRDRVRVISSYVKRSLAEDRFSDMSICYFGEIVRNRCRMECKDVRKNNNIYYFPIAFELTSGCSVQCDFCGLCSKPYEGQFELNEENMILFEEILRISKEIIGDVVGSCPLYFATEPFDNRNYEKFLYKVGEIFGKIPQTTTAACDRDRDRFVKLLNDIGRDKLKERASVRISVRNHYQFNRIMELYSEDELENMEIVACNPESINRVSDSGRSRNNPNITDIRRLDYSISCIAGFLVSLTKKEISFIEPEIPCDEYPNGYRVREKLCFDNAEDFKNAIINLRDKYAVYKLPINSKLYWNKKIKIDLSKEDTICFTGDGISLKIAKLPIFLYMIEGVNLEYSFSEITGRLGITGALYDSLYDRVQELYLRGYLRI